MLLSTIDLAFLLLSTLIVIFTWRHGVGIGASFHSIFFVLLVTGLQTMWRVGSEAQYEVITYVATHLVAVTYLGLFNLVALWARGTKEPDYPVIASAAAVKDGIWQGVIVLWIVWQAYLIGRYGILNLYAFKYNLGVAGTEHGLAYVDMAVNSMLSTVALGAVLVYVTKAVSIRGYWFGLVRVTLVGVFLCVYLVFGESPLGVRRTLVLMVLFALVVHAVLYRGHVFEWLHQSWRHVLFAVIIAAGFASYYQAIRGNFSDPEVADMLLSESPREQLEGVMRYALPQSEPPAGESTAMLRSGPFDLIYKLVESDRSTNGELLLLSIQTAVPRIVMADKPENNVDDVIADRLGIVPEGDYLSPDLSTSVLAVFIADYGFGGVILAAGLMAGVLVLLTLVIPRAKRHPLVLLGVLAMLFQLAGNVEGDLVAILAGLRDLLLLALVVVPLDWAIRVVVHAMKKSVLVNHAVNKKP